VYGIDIENVKDKRKGVELMQTIHRFNIWVVAMLAIVVVSMFGSMATVSAADAQLNFHNSAIDYFEQMPSHGYRISEVDLKKLVDVDDQSIYIVDIRDYKDFEKGHIKNAVNFPFRELGKYLDALPQDKTIIVYCYTGQTAGQATAIFNMAGFQSRSLSGGMNNGWLKQGFPVVAD